MITESAAGKQCGYIHGEAGQHVRFEYVGTGQPPNAIVGPNVEFPIGRVHQPHFLALADQSSEYTRGSGTRKALEVGKDDHADRNACCRSRGMR